MSLSKALLVLSRTLLTLSLLLNFAPLVTAQESGLSVPSVYEVADQEAKEGDILVSTDKGIVRANAAADPRLFGIKQDKALVAVRNKDETGTVILKSGAATVNVSNLNGNIAPGDFITSSEIPGVGQKASDDGYIIGTATQKFDGEGAEKVDRSGKQVATGAIQVSVSIQNQLINTPGGGPSFINRLVVAYIKDPKPTTTIIRYTFATALILASLALGIMTISRTIRKGVEAIGRNPMAKDQVNFPIKINVIYALIGVSLTIIVAGFLIIK